MKLVILFGPPAVGKLTVAQALEQLTGFRLIHHHLLLDLATALFGHGSPSHRQLVRKTRHLVLEEALAAGLPGLIVTFVYARDREPYINELSRFVEARGGQVCLVHFHGDQEILERRVGAESRRHYGKLLTVAGLRDKLDSLREPFSAVADRKSLSLSTGALQPHEAATQITAHFDLPRMYR